MLIDFHIMNIMIIFAKIKYHIMGPKIFKDKLIKLSIKVIKRDCTEVEFQKEKKEFKLTDKHLIIGGIVLGAILLLIIIRFIIIKINDRKIDKALDDL